jgi:glutamine synthetase
MAKLAIRDILRQADKDKVELIELQFSDFHGRVKSVTITSEQLPDTLADGVWFDGSSVEGFARIAESDMVLHPDLNTYAILPWWSNESSTVARFICDVKKPNGESFEGDPRHILKKVIQEAEELGYTYNVGPEIEFFLFKRDESGKIIVHSRGNGDYFVLSMDETYNIKREMIKTLATLGIETETSHYEVANNQHEIDFKYSDALTAADSSITFKYALKKIAADHGYYASFMPKPIYGVNGSGMHCHQSLFNKKDENAFIDTKDKYGLSKIAYQFTAGQLKNIREITALVAPTVNSYKRLTPGFEAPVYTCWARENRSALIRIPQISPGKEISTRVELRCPDTSCNPYLAFAVMLKAGLEGIKEKMEAPDPVEEDVYKFDDEQLEKRYIDKLPGSLEESLNEMKKGSIAKKVLGNYTYKRYTNAKQEEWDSFRTTVTRWEHDRYLEIL